MNYQIIIATERRTEPERMATAITSTVQQGDEFVAGPQQLHSYTAADLRVKVYRDEPNPTPRPDGWPGLPEDGCDAEEWIERCGEWPETVRVFDHYEEPDFSDPRFVMVAEWDGHSPYVVVHKGDYSTRNMAYAGWPEITEEQFLDNKKGDIP